ncbi:unnamed protein product [Protopolystoma xenopodis]|uniref:Uncharacterized protein n=1 Tax=Protopolystoma xenopodis TaxID=117903 RepID=A0A448X1L8_9PLAT|nr:unnamed protein product [Protopolystoma xenopodis]
MDAYLQAQAMLQAALPSDYGCLNQVPQPSGYGTSVGNTTALAVYNLPHTTDEAYILGLFPLATKVNIVLSQSEPRRPRGTMTDTIFLFCFSIALAGAGLFVNHSFDEPGSCLSNCAFAMQRFFKCPFAERRFVTSNAIGDFEA